MLDKLPSNDVHAPHSGRHGGNVLNHKHAVTIGRALLSHLVAGSIVITNAEPAFDSSDVAGTISKELDDIESGAVKLVKLEGFPVAEAGQHRGDGVRVTWETPNGKLVSRRVDWRLA